MWANRSDSRNTPKERKKMHKIGILFIKIKIVSLKDTHRIQEKKIRIPLIKFDKFQLKFCKIEFA